MNPPRNRFCGSCGASLSEDAAPRAETARPRQTSGARKKPQGQKSQSTRPASTTLHLSIKPWQLILAVGVIVAGFIIIVMMKQPAVTTTSGQAPSETVPPGPTVNLEQLDRLKTAVESNPGDKQALLAYANALHDARLWQQSIAQYQRYLKDMPDDVNARVDMGVCYFELAQYDDAIREMERGVQTDPNHVLGNFNLGIVNKTAGRPQKAAEWFRKAIALSPNSRTAEQARAVLQEMGFTN